MRTATAIAAVLLMGSVLATAAVAQTIAANGNGYNGSGYINMGIYGASACSGPAYCGPLVPGCCEYPPNCRCSHIWDGYCQEKGSCCWPLLRLPSIRCPDWRKCFADPYKATAACGVDCGASCVNDTSCNVSQGPAMPSHQPRSQPSVHEVNPAPSQPAAPLPETDKKTENPPSPLPSSAWRFMPAGDAFRR